MRHSPQCTWLHLLATTVGYARIHRRAHYLSDVLAGGTIGYTVGWCADLTWKVLKTAVNL